MIDGIGYYIERTGTITYNYGACAGSGGSGHIFCATPALAG